MHRCWDRPPIGAWQLMQSDGKETRMYEYHVRCDGRSGKVVSMKWAVSAEASVEMEDQVGRGGGCLRRKEADGVV